VDTEAFDQLLARATRATRPPPVPEIVLHLADDLPALWSAREAVSGRTGSAAPYWGVAWPGGLALARYLLDEPQWVAGLRVLDVGSGSGICAIAAAIAGAREVIAADLDPDACLAIARNAALNGVHVATMPEDPLGLDATADLILAADLWYERFFAHRVTAWLASQARAGRTVLAADTGRSYGPRTGLEELARREIVPAPGLEPGGTTLARVFRFLPAAPPPAFRA
jgi:predicted nicotinamide N-methyase